MIKRFIKKQLSQYKLWCLLIVVLSFFLRFHQYAQFPVYRETVDEIAWSWLGASLIEDGIPTSWSHFSPYKDHVLTTLESGTKIVRPVFDHPPLFSFIPGAMHALTSDNWLQAPSIKAIRFPLIFIGTLNTWLMIRVAKLLFKKDSWSLFTGLIYATVPSFVFGSRMVLAENLLITWYLLAIWLLLSSQIRQRLMWLTLLTIAAFLTKFSGIALALGLIAIGLKHQDYPLAKIGAIGGLLGIVIFFIYGAIYDFPLMLAVQLSQGSRNIGLATLHNRWLVHPAVVSKTYLDGWFALSFISFFYLLFGTGKKQLSSYAWSIIKILGIISLGFLLISTGEQTFHGWYNYVFYPLFTLALVKIIKDVMDHRLWLALGSIWLLILPSLRLLMVNTGLYDDLTTLHVRLLISLGFIPFITALLNRWQNKKFDKLLAWIVLIVMITINIATVLTISDQGYTESEVFWKNLIPD